MSASKWVLAWLRLAGERTAVIVTGPEGTSVEVTDSVGRELIASGKAERAQTEPPAPPPGPLTTQTAAAVVKGKAKDTAS